MIYVTGDTHIDQDIHKLGSRAFPESKKMTKNDYVIICGDFGGVWSADRKDNYWLNWLEKKRFTTLFLDGNHENFDALSQYETRSWNGGEVQFIRPSVIHLMRGYVYRLDGLDIFTLGGGHSTDRSIRREGVSWWPQEMPDAQELLRARQNLALHDNQVDFILTHDAPLSLAMRINPAKTVGDRLMPFLEELKNTVVYRHWYFGHLHTDRVMDERHTALFNRILPIVPPEKEAPFHENH